MATAFSAVIGLHGLLSAANEEPVTSLSENDMLNPQKTLGREALLKRIRELDAEIAQHERNCGKGRLG